MKAAALVLAVALACPDAIPPASRSLNPAHTGLLRTLVPPFLPTLVDVTADGLRAAAAGGGGVAVFSTLTGRLIFQTRPGDDVVSLEFSPSGSLLAVQRVGGRVEFYERGGESWSWSEAVPGQVRWARDGGSLWCSTSGELRRVAVRKPAILDRVKTGGATMPWFVFSPDERWLVLEDPQRPGRVVEKATNRVAATLEEPARGAWAFSGDGRRLAVARSDRLEIRDLVGDRTTTLSGPMPCQRMAFTADGRVLVGTGADDSLALWTVDGPDKPSAVLKHHSGRVHDVAVSRHAAVVVSCATDGFVKVWGRVPGGMAKVRPKGYMGVRLDTDSGRCVVVDVVPGHPAEAAGLRMGDAILAVDGQAVPNHMEVIRRVTAHLVGDEIEVEVKSGEAESRKIRIRLGHRPER